jgi:hypothetical protein
VTFAIHDDACRCRELGEEISMAMVTTGPEHAFEAKTEAEADAIGSAVGSLLPGPSGQAEALLGAALPETISTPSTRGV